ncbi:MAG: glycosyltransferase, partial [Thermoanaerobaculia bacterium]
QKPVVTCTDSGGPLEFVVDGENGRVVPPDGTALGAAVADLLAQPKKAREFGERGFERVREIRWENAVMALLEAGGIW